MDSYSLGSVDTVSIANLATSLQQEETAAQVSVSLLDKALDVQTELASQLIQLIDVGANLDVEA